MIEGLQDLRLRGWDMAEIALPEAEKIMNRIEKGLASKHNTISAGSLTGTMSFDPNGLFQDEAWMLESETDIVESLLGLDVTCRYCITTSKVTDCHPP